MEDTNTNTDETTVEPIVDEPTPRAERVRYKLAEEKSTFVVSTSAGDVEITTDKSGFWTCDPNVDEQAAAARALEVQPYEGGN